MMQSRLGLDSYVHVLIDDLSSVCLHGERMC